MVKSQQDLDLHAKKKKLLRLIGAQFLAGQTPDLPKLQLQLRELKLDDVAGFDRRLQRSARPVAGLLDSKEGIG